MRRHPATGHAIFSDPGSPEISLCENGHFLVEFEASSRRYFCGMCKKPRGPLHEQEYFPVGTQLWGCRLCNFDICQDCRYKACAPCESRPRRFWKQIAPVDVQCRQRMCFDDSARTNRIVRPGE